MRELSLAAKNAKAVVARAPDVARAPSPLQQGRGGLATSAWRKGGAV